jgi:uncharacterized protein with PhoU and TrkA domain
MQRSADELYGLQRKVQVLNTSQQQLCSSTGRHQQQARSVQAYISSNDMICSFTDAANTNDRKLHS